MKMTVENIVLVMENVNSRTHIVVYELDGTKYDFYGYEDLIDSNDSILTREVASFLFEDGNRLIIEVS